MAPMSTDIVARQISIRLRRESLGLVATSLLVGTLGTAPLLGMLAPGGSFHEEVRFSAPTERVAHVMLTSEPIELELDATEPEEAVAEEPAVEEPAAEEAPPQEEAIAAAPAPEPRDEPASVPPLAKEIEVPKRAEAIERATRPAVDLAAAKARMAEQRRADRLAARKAARAERCGPRHPDIRPLGPDRFEVKRDLVVYHTKSVKRIQQLAGGGPFRGDDAKGWQIRSFGCSSPLYKGGLRHNDVIQTVNGKKMNNIIQILGIWMTERHRTDFDVTVLRKGKPVVLHYRLI